MTASAARVPGRPRSRLARLLGVRVAAVSSALITGALGPAAWASTPGAPPVPLAGVDLDNPLGPLVNVTADWRYYQPAPAFCIPDPNDVYELPPDTDNTATLHQCRSLPLPAARPLDGKTATEGEEGDYSSPAFRSHPRSLYEVSLSDVGGVDMQAPPLCRSCVRLFFDYERIAPSTPRAPSAHGHAYLRLLSLDAGYSSSPFAHSPNIKNLSNDTLVAPPRSVRESAAERLDPHLLTYAADTLDWAHDGAQGPYYIGPAYLNQYGNWVDGAYIDVQLASGTARRAAFEGIYYGALYDSDPSSCPDATLGPALASVVEAVDPRAFRPGQSFADGNYGYGGCVDAAGGSAGGIYPYGSRQEARYDR